MATIPQPHSTPAEVLAAGCGLMQGAHMSREDFHRAYLNAPDGFKVELIEGVVYVSSPASHQHGHPHAHLTTVQGNYCFATPGTGVYTDTSLLFGKTSEVQPVA